MTKNQNNGREQLEMLTIEQLAPQDHLVRKLDAAIDFSFIYPLVISQCTESKNHQKMIQRQIWQDYLDVAEDLRHNHEIKELDG
ncbi:hypothetical protein J2Z23_002259 [Lederbergia galactosidilyticus]|nr:hypothetical protein [Lederbergia galactosidilytica]